MRASGLKSCANLTSDVYKTGTKSKRNFLHVHMNRYENQLNHKSFKLFTLPAIFFFTVLL
jgi:hypothetical protein